MRIASWIVGALLAITGLVFISFAVVFLVTFRPESVLAGPQWGKRLTGGLPALVVGIGFILAGWYFFRLDVDKLDEACPPSRFAPFFIAHRRELKFIAQAGLAISLVGFAAACVGVDWPGRWVSWVLGPVWAGLLIISTRIASGRVLGHPDWERVPERMRLPLRIMWNAVGATLWILWLLSLWNQWSRHQASSRVLESGIVVLLFAWEALFFGYGKLGARNQVT
jgi:hypothetical protein